MPVVLFLSVKSARWIVSGVPRLPSLPSLQELVLSVEGCRQRNIDCPRRYLR